VAATIAREGAAGRAWIESLPDRIESLTRRWDLSHDGPYLHGYVGIVVPVVRRDRKCMLKISWQDADTEHESDALRAWAGNGAVELIDFDRAEGALLLERLDARMDLTSLPPDRSIEVAAQLLRRLSIVAPSWSRSLEREMESMRTELPERWQSAGRPGADSLLERACRIIDELGPSSGDRLVNTDLHYQNVLAGQREPWLVIDPKVLAGDPEYGAAPLLWQPFPAIRSRRELDRRLDILVEAAELDASKARAWTFVRVLDYWFWALEQGLSEESARCAVLAEWLTESEGMPGPRRSLHR
jgi:streptomycin 6-kinase